MDEPERWLTSAEAPGEMRALLRAARTDLPEPSVISRVGARLGSPGTGGITGNPRVLWLVGTAGLVGAGIAAYWALPTGESVTPARAPAAEVQQHIAVEPPPQQLAPAESPDFVESSDAPHSTVRPATKLTTQPAPVASGPAEVALIRQARAAVSADPELALRLVEQHRTTYPHGKLAEEREVIAVQALAHLGRTKDAESRAAAFAQEHPTSPHVPRVERESKAVE